MPAAPPAAETKKPATPPPDKAPADKGKAGGSQPDKAATTGASKTQDKAPAKPAAAGGDKAAAPQGRKAAAAEKPGTGQQRFDRMAVRAKLAVSEPGDAVEREADAMAAKVMRAPAPGERKPSAAQQRSEPGVRRKEAADADPGAPSTSTELLARLGPGQPLDADAHSFFEQRLGHSLADVRVHTDQAAADAARTLQARAFTWGHHIAFASGEYRPASHSGRELIAHELAHVLQNESAGLSHVVMRKKDGNPRYTNPTDVQENPDNPADGAFDPAKRTPALPGLQTLKLPSIKARHAPIYQKHAGKDLKRPKGYDRRKDAFATAQVSKWNEALAGSLQGLYSQLGSSGKPDKLRFYGSPKKNVGKEDVLDRIRIPQWGPDGSWTSGPLQVDHILEVQVGGADDAGNYELLTGAHNTNVGSLLRASIYAGVKGYLAATGKNTGDDVVKDYLVKNDVDFKTVAGGGEGKNLEKTSQFWSLDQIKQGAHLTWLKDEDHPEKDEGKNKNRFALYSNTDQGFIDAFDLSGIVVSVANTGRLAGIAIKSIALKKGFDKLSSGSVGTLTGSWQLPAGVEIDGPKTLQSDLTVVPDKPYAGAMQAVTAPKAKVKGASPVTFGDIDFNRGQLSVDGTLKTDHPLFPGVELPVRWRGKDFAFEYTIEAGKISLPVPGLSIPSSSVTLFFGSQGLGADGSVEYVINDLGSGTLGVSASYGAGGPQISAQGTFTADHKLFDDATLEVGWSSKEGFSGGGRLGITDPEKIKGIKSASLQAHYAKGVFSATGTVTPDIPGLKSASLGVTYDKTTLIITGQLAVDDKVPGVEGGQIKVTVAKGPAPGQAGEGSGGGTGTDWAVSASGQIKPKIPGLTGASFDFKYDKGDVTLEAGFDIKKGRLDGKVIAGVTNAPVDSTTGKKSGKGTGERSFKVYGAADIHCDIYPGKIDGNLGLRLLTDGSMRMKGSLGFGPIKLFGQIPENADLFNVPIKSPRLPLPGLGFTVGQIAVGVNFWAEAYARGFASVGPGLLKGSIGIEEEFDPLTAKWDQLTFKGHADFTANANAGIELGGNICVAVSAAVIEAGAKLGLTGGIRIPDAKQPALKADADFTYSAEKGLDIVAGLKVDLDPALELALKGTLFAQANLYVKTVTLWSREWDLANVSYPLELGLKVDKSIGYNSKTNKFTVDPASALNIGDPKLDPGKLTGPLTGDKQPIQSNTTDSNGQTLSNRELRSREPRYPNACYADDPGSDSQMSLNPAREPDSHATPSAVDEGLVDRLGPAQPLDLATQGFFEQELKAPLSDVRVHTGASAQREAKALSARAFTVGEHIAFAAGEYRPSTPEGRGLLAHELTHVVQQTQAGAPRAAARLPDGPGSVTTTATPGHAASGSASAGGIPALSVAQERLETFVLPVSKRRHGPAYQAWLDAGRLRHGPNYARGTPAQIGVWETELQGAEATSAWTDHFTRLGVSPGAGGSQTITFAGDHRESKTFSDWVQFFKRPKWDHHGNWLPNRLEVDHVVELQVAGWPAAPEGNTAQNLEMLDRGANGDSGRTIDLDLFGKMRTLLAAERGVSSLDQVSGDDARAALSTRQINFRTVQGVAAGGHGDASSEFWVLSELRAGEQLAAIHSPPAATGGSGTPQRFVLLSAGAGGMEILGVDTSSGHDVAITGSAATRMASMTLNHVHLNDGYGTATANDPIGSLQGTWRLPTGITPAGPDPSFALKKAANGQFNGYAEAPGTLSANATGLSPIEFTGLSLDGAGINATGRLMPSVPLFANQPIDVTWMHDDIRFSRTFAADDLNLRVPGITLDAASVTVFYNRDGFGAEGSVYFTMAHLGTGSLTAGVDGAGHFSAEGRLDLNTRTFDEASLSVWYRQGAFGGSGHLGITQPGRIRGVNSASIDVTADAQSVSATGNVQPAIPGVQNAALTASYGAEHGLVVAGDLQLANVAGIREGSVHAQVQKQDGQWHLSAAGRAVPALPGISSEITLSYADGVFDGSLSVDWSRGIFSGNVTVGVTNRAVSPDGDISGAAPADGTGGGPGGAAGAAAGALSIYGSGTVTARVTDWLQGSIGVRVRPAGDLLISGSIGIPAPVTVFDAYPPPDRATRTLFSMPTVSVPLVGLSVGSTVVGVALTINGRITGHAQVGPGRLTQTVLRVEDFNPAQPESLHITGDAEFSVGAEAGVAASLDAGVSLGAAIINATAGVNVSASAVLAAEARPHVNLDWRAATGLALHADLDASLTPRLAFDVNGFAEVTANAFVTTFSLWRKDWNLAHREIGSNLALRVHAPVDYFSDGRGVVFDPEQVRFDVPTLNGDTLRQLLADGNERQEAPDPARAPGRPGAAGAAAGAEPSRTG